MSNQALCPGLWASRVPGGPPTGKESIRSRWGCATPAPFLEPALNILAQMAQAPSRVCVLFSLGPSLGVDCTADVYTPRAQGWPNGHCLRAGVGDRAWVSMHRPFQVQNRVWGWEKKGGQLTLLLHGHLCYPGLGCMLSFHLVFKRHLYTGHSRFFLFSAC